MFVVGGMSLSTICKNNKVIWYILFVEVALGDLFTEIMGCSAINDRGIPVGTVREANNVAD